MLLVTYNVPQLHDVQIPGVEVAIIKAYHAIKTWEKNPSIRVCVERIEKLMLDLRIPLQDPSPISSYR